MAELAQARQWHRQGDLARAIEAYRIALRASPEDVAAWHDYAVALLQAGRAGEAAGALQEALRIAPGHPDLLLAMAQARQRAGQHAGALESAIAAADAAPDNPLAWLLRGRLEALAGAGAAEASLRRAVALEPRLDEAWHYLGEVLQRQGRWDEAAQAYRQAMRSQPGEVMNIGICAEQAGHWEQARQAYRSMCGLYPERRDCLARLARIEAMLCDFPAASASTARLAALLASGPAHPEDCAEPFALAHLEVPDALRVQATRHYVQRILRRAPVPLPPAAATPGPRLRIGYLGADFGRHAVGLLLRGLFAAHDRNRFEVLGYSLRRHDDQVAAALAAEFDVFRDLHGAPVADIARRIRDDGVDVLIDLGGYTGGARPEVLAMRPAPVQLGWLGFIDGHEAPWLDGLLLDRHVQPDDAPWPWSDRILRLPGLLFPCGPMPAGKPDRTRFGLPEGVPLLASFNNSYKLDAELVEAWIRTLARVPQAHLAVYLPPEARPHFLRAWQAGGGDPLRLHVLDHVPFEAQADRAASCDLFLDAFRYQAGATAMSCVAAGLPVLGREGHGTLARLGTGINRFLGLDELVCADTAQYIDRAAALASEPARLAALRARMREAASATGLFDPRRAAAAIESVIDGLPAMRASAPMATDR
ncbi:tetratricopeptide repeat protein [Pseudoxanthomonas suwonensis]|uniref:O-linked N-acetylglucosamine transferase, SPINDLY family protein n=1 Tax=Pseudoxanthomonas suwonensis TaxID=314722 RepID=UPI00138F5D13|nr:tetratricopeptide repeat protein [Pseudoxanthomonas suwonensis]KAF1700966.1 hypothetical protein CSC68_10305 [Pseudoxanthomonas suwonensis]